MKLCKKCNTEKQLSDFPKNKGKKNGVTASCKDCTNAYFRNRYKNQEIKQKHRVLAKRNALNYRERNRKILLTFLSSHPCIDCDEKDPIVLELDHIHNKKYDISTMINSGFSTENIYNELSKCVVRCANCHRRKTANERKYYKTLLNNSECNSMVE